MYSELTMAAHVACPGQRRRGRSPLKILREGLKQIAADRDRWPRMMTFSLLYCQLDDGTNDLSCAAPSRLVSYCQPAVECSSSMYGSRLVNVCLPGRVRTFVRACVRACVWSRACACVCLLCTSDDPFWKCKPALQGKDYLFELWKVVHRGSSLAVNGNIMLIMWRVILSRVIASLWRYLFSVCHPFLIL